VRQGWEWLKVQAKASLRAWQLRARELGMDQMSDQDIDAEVKAARAERRLIGKPNVINAKTFPEGFR